MFRFTLHLLIALILTLLTQIGGIAYVVALAASHAWGLRRFLAKLAIFLLCYASATIAASFAAPIFGRVPLSCIAGATDRLVVRSPIYCLLNRNYVTPEVHDLAKALAVHMDGEFPGTVTVALDANFPFVNGFPLLPHLSHADGKKLDFAYYYKDVDGAFLNGATRSPIGYFAFEQPARGDELPCEGRNDAHHPLELRCAAASVSGLSDRGAAHIGGDRLVGKRRCDALRPAEDLHRAASEERARHHRQPYPLSRLPRRPPRRPYSYPGRVMVCL